MIEFLTFVDIFFFFSSSLFGFLDVFLRVEIMEVSVDLKHSRHSPLFVAVAFLPNLSFSYHFSP